MAGFLLHEGKDSTVQCLHAPGLATPDQTDLRVKVSGQRIVTQANIYTITGCSLPPPPNGNGPCAKATWNSAATRVPRSDRLP